MTTIREKILEQSLRSAMKKREKLFKRAFGTINPTDFEKKVLAKYELMEYLIPRYEQLLDGWIEALRRVFELEGKDEIIMNGSILIKENEEASYKEVKQELAIMLKPCEDEGG